MQEECDKREERDQDSGDQHRLGWNPSLTTHLLCEGFQANLLCLMIDILKVKRIQESNLIPGQEAKEKWVWYKDTVFWGQPRIGKLFPCSQLSHMQIPGGNTGMC
jgi:hypothetical protein